MWTATRNRLAGMLSSGYDAISSTGKRKASSTILRHEDDQLKGRDRQQSIGTGRDLARNSSIVAWAIRKHLDYVTHFDFQMRTENDEFNETVETLFREWSRPDNCDQAGRHSFPSMLRQFEQRRTVDGDVFALFRRFGRISAIEGDRIRQPDEMETGSRWFNGINVNADGRAMRYALHDRTQHGRYEFAKFVPRRNMCHHGYFSRFDQVRGISPIMAAMNSFKDVYEGIDFALAKMKVEQLFAMVVTSDSSVGLGDHTQTGDGYDVDFGKGPVKVEMDPGDDAKFLKTDNPGSNTREFIHTVLGIALKSLDIPFNFYDEAHTNFFGSRAAWLLYDRSCMAKRADVLELLRKITVWKLQGWVLDGMLQLPAGMTIRDLPFEWVARGMPWWDPAKEIKGDLMAIGAGLDNPYRVCKERGRGEFEDNVKQIAKAQAFAESMGVTLSLSTATAAPQPPEPDDEEGDE